MIQAISEADFVIKYFAVTLEKPSLVMSYDTDYVVLLAEVPDVYKSDLKGQEMYYPYELWSNFDIKSVEDLWFLATITGNDYSINKYLIADESHYFAILDLKNEYNVFNRCKKIKQYITDEVIYGDDPFRNLMRSMMEIESVKLSMNIYKNWQYNCSFVDYLSKFYNEDDVLKNVFDRLEEQFKTIYTWTVKGYANKFSDYFEGITGGSYVKIDLDFRDKPTLAFELD
jgi:hypothetical protein